jgi:hypothetical protein
MRVAVDEFILIPPGESTRPVDFRWYIGSYRGIKQYRKLEVKIWKWSNFDVRKVPAKERGRSLGSDK